MIFMILLKTYICEIYVNNAKDNNLAKFPAYLAVWMLLVSSHPNLSPLLILLLRCSLHPNFRPFLNA